MIPIYLGVDDTVPLDLNTLIASKAIAQANSGGGKSWLLRRLLEQTYGRIQHIVRVNRFTEAALLIAQCHALLRGAWRDLAAAKQAFRVPAKRGGAR